MIKKGDTVIYNGETVKVMATPETVHSGDSRYYLIEGYSGGWYPSPGQPRGNYGVENHKKYYWVIDPKHLTPVNFAGGSSLTAADIKPVRTKYKVGERVIYEGSEAVIARVDAGRGVSGDMYIIQLFTGKGWSGNSHGLSPTVKYWAVSEFELAPAPVQTKIPVEAPYRVTLPHPVHYGDGSFGSAGMMASMVDPYYDKHRSERSLVSDVERDYQKAKHYYEKAASLGVYFHTGNNNVLLGGLHEKKSDKPVTNQSPDAYIQQPIIITKRKTKHSLTTV